MVGGDVELERGVDAHQQMKRLDGQLLQQQRRHQSVVRLQHLPRKCRLRPSATALPTQRFWDVGVEERLHVVDEGVLQIDARRPDAESEAVQASVGGDGDAQGQEPCVALRLLAQDDREVEASALVQLVVHLQAGAVDLDGVDGRGFAGRQLEQQFGDGET